MNVLPFLFILTQGQPLINPIAESLMPLIAKAVDELAAALDKEDATAVEKLYKFPSDLPTPFKEALLGKVMLEHKLDKLLREKHGTTFEGLLPLPKGGERVPAMTKAFLAELKAATAERVELDGNEFQIRLKGYCVGQPFMRDPESKRVCFLAAPWSGLQQATTASTLRNVGAALILQNKWAVARMVRLAEREGSAAPTPDQEFKFYYMMPPKNEWPPMELPDPKYLKQKPTNPQAEWRRIWFVDRP